VNTLNLYRRHVQALVAEAEAEKDRIHQTARGLYIAGDELGASRLLASDAGILPMQRIGYLGNMLAALGTLEGNVARLVVYGGFSDPLATILAEIDREARAAAAEMQRLEALDEARQSSDTESAWYEARGRHEALNKALGLLTGYTQIQTPSSPPEVLVGIDHPEGEARVLAATTSVVVHFHYNRDGSTDRAPAQGDPAAFAALLAESQSA
jgi:hypothetical protein